MTPREGQTRVRKLLGPKAGWRDNGRATSEEQRLEARTAAIAAKAAYEDVKAKRDALMRELLDHDRYKSLVKSTQDARKHMEDLQGSSFRHRLTVGINQGWCFEVRAEGDNWADVVRKLEEKNR